MKICYMIEANSHAEFRDCVSGLYQMVCLPAGPNTTSPSVAPINDVNCVGHSKEVEGVEGVVTGVGCGEVGAADSVPSVGVLTGAGVNESSGVEETPKKSRSKKKAPIEDVEEKSIISPSEIRAQAEADKGPAAVDPFAAPKAVLVEAPALTFEAVFAELQKVNVAHGLEKVREILKDFSDKNGQACDRLTAVKEADYATLVAKIEEELGK